MYRIGDLVISKSGRDKGRKLVVTGITDENYVLIADGDLRKVENPKRKKLKHLQYAGTSSYTDNMTDSQLKKMLKENSES